MRISHSPTHTARERNRHGTHEEGQGKLREGFCTETRLTMKTLFWVPHQEFSLHIAPMRSRLDVKLDTTTIRSSPVLLISLISR